MSSSVADALEFLMTDVSDPNFKNAAATIEFIRKVDRIFDLLNSRNPLGKFYKVPIKKDNKDFWNPLFKDGLEYLKTLKHSNGEPLHISKNKTAILGFSITIKSIIGMYEDYIEKQNMLKYMLTYKFSQDHLELFFCCIRFVNSTYQCILTILIIQFFRGRNGWNNNPTAFQFYYTFKRLMMQHDIKRVNGNCFTLDNTTILGTSQTQIQPDITLDEMSLIKKYNIDINDMVIDTEEFQGILKFLPTLTSLTENVVGYIAGFVVKSIKKVIKCKVCISILEEERKASVDLDYFKLLNRKNRADSYSGLTKPSADVVKCCMFTERKVKQIMALTNNLMPAEKQFMDVFVTNISGTLFGDIKLFSQLDDHVFDISMYEMNHKMKLIKCIVKIYSKIRCHSFARLQTESVRGELKRKKLSKLILFSHQ